MERSYCRRLVQITVYLTLCGLCTAGEEVDVITPGTGSFINIVEKGVVFVNQHHLTFRIKACKDCVIVFSNIVAITDTDGSYFLLLLGSKNNSLVVVEDSCFSCERNSKRELSLLKCDQFVSLWVSWDGKRQLLFGTGNHPGNNTLLEMKGTRRQYPVMNIAVTSSEGAPAHWIFDSGKLPTSFLQPLPNGLSLIAMNEALPVGSEVVKILLRSAPRNTTFTLSGESASLFAIQEDVIKLTRVLTYCEKHFHVIQLRSSTTGLATSVTVEVVRSHRGRGGVHIISPLVLLEELPVGAVIPWSRQASDTGDNYTYTIHGPLMEYFDIRRHELLLRKRLDVDKDTSIASVVNMTISRGDALYNISLTISDVNDNPPVFESELYILPTEPNFAADTHLVDLVCHDDDIGDLGVFDLSISHTALGVFYVKNTSLYMRSGRSDLARSQPEVHSFLVLAADTSSTRGTQTGTAVVVVKILPNTGTYGHRVARAGQSDHPQAHFDQAVYEIEEEHLHTEIEKAHLTVHVEGLTEPQDVHIVLDNNGERYFHVQKRQSTFQLLLKKGFANDSGFPSSILMNLMNPLKQLKISTAYILIRGFLTVCQVPDMKDVAPRVRGRGHRRHVVQDNGCPQVDKTLDNILITISIYEGACLLALIVVYRKRRRKEQFKRYSRKGSSVTKPIRQEPIGCEADSDVEETAIDDLKKQQTTASKTNTRGTSFNGDVSFKNPKAQFQGDYIDTEDNLPNTRKSTMKLDSNYQGVTSISVCESVNAVAPNSVVGDGEDESISVYDYVYTNVPNSVAGDGGDKSISVYDNVYTNVPNSVVGHGGDESMSVLDSVSTLTPDSVAEDEGEVKTDCCCLEEDDTFTSQKMPTSFS